MSFWRAMTSLRRCAIPQDWYMVPAISIPENIWIPECSCAHSAISLMLVEASIRVRVLVMQKRADYSSFLKHGQIEFVRVLFFYASG